MIQNFIFEVFFKKIFDNYIFVHTFQWTSLECFFTFSFSKFNKTGKKITYLAIQFHSKKPHSFYEPELTRHWKIYAPATQTKTFLNLQIFQQSSDWCQKKNWRCIISRSPRNALLKHFESNYQYISVYLPEKIFVPKK